MKKSTLSFILSFFLTSVACIASATDDTISRNAACKEILSFDKSLKAFAEEKGCPGYHSILSDQILNYCSKFEANADDDSQKFSFALPEANPLEQKAAACKEIQDFDAKWKSNAEALGCPAYTSLINEDFQPYCHHVQKELLKTPLNEITDSLENMSPSAINKVLVLLDVEANSFSKIVEYYDKQYSRLVQACEIVPQADTDFWITMDVISDTISTILVDLSSGSSDALDEYYNALVAAVMQIDAYLEGTDLQALLGD